MSRKNHHPDGLFLGPLRPEDLHSIEQQPLHLPEGFHFVSSGYFALRLLLRSLKIKAHARVALPALICPTVVNAIRAEGMLPLFLDIEPPFFFMIFAPDTLAHLRPDALLLPHLYNVLHPKTGEIMAYCREEGIPLIHDAAQSFGLLWEGKPVIQQDQGGFYSFGPGKATTAATGALVWGIDADIAKSTALAKPRFWDPYAHAFMRQRMGLPSRFFWPRHPSRQIPASRVQIRAAHWVMANFATIEERRTRNTREIIDRLGPDVYEPLRGGRPSYKYVFYSPTPWKLPQDLTGIPFRRVTPFPASGNLSFYSSWNGFLYEISTERSLKEYQWYYNPT